MFRLITLDANNTLLRVRGSVGNLYRKVAKQYGQSFDEKELDNEFIKAYKIYNKKYPNFGVDHNITTQCFWYKIVRATFVNSGLKDDDLISKIASSLYQDFALSKNWELFDDVHPVLQHLKTKGYTLGIVSNFDERLPTILEGLGVLEYFSFVLCSTEVKVAKPLPGIFNLALQKAGVEPVEALHVGDNLMLDYNAAKAVGMSAFLIDRFKNFKQEKTEKESVIDPSHIITKLEALLSL